MKTIFNGLAALSLLSFITPASAQGPWHHRPGTDHWYRRTVDGNAQAGWQVSQDIAVSWGGNLVTIRSQEEQDWLMNQPDLDSITWPWIGLYQDTTDASYSEPGGAWKWVSGEPVTFTAWVLNTPDDDAGAEDFAQFRDDGWNDEQGDVINSGIAEIISTDCDGNGLPDVFELATGSGQDTNANGVLDACELTWIERPNTGQWFAVAAQSRSWGEHEQISSSLGGSLAIIEDQSEQDWVFSQFSASVPLWIGLFQDPSHPSYSEPGGGWRWVNGQSLSYSNWDSSEPNDINGEDYAEINSGPSGNWGDSDQSQTISALYECSSVDCDGNQTPDIVEIALDPSLDSNSDGILDSCGGGGPYSWEEDCNGNGTADTTDIANGTSFDRNLDGRPDECNPHSQIVFEHTGENGAHGRHAVVDDLN
ncbi:MAG: hypothetical protein MK291_10660, partial [Planctomycetes bacterium]|nr:hypothetical protein [Planctomycetota bacterium]